MVQRNSRSSNSRPWVKKVDFVFYHEREIREAVLDERSTCTSAPIVRNASGVSDPTARDAIYNLSPLPMVKIDGKELRLPERWLFVIDTTYAWAKEDNPLRYEVAKLKYSGTHYKMICIDCHISMKFQYLLLENFRKFAFAMARDLNLVRGEEFLKIFS